MDDKSPRIDQLLCTHCTYGTSLLHQNTAHLKDQVFEYSARAGTVDRTQSHDIFRRIEPYLYYRLPADASHAALIENSAKTLPKRLVYLPHANGLRIVAQVSYRRYDVTKRRAGAYFAHVLLESVGDSPRGPQGRPAPPPPPKTLVSWSARDAAQMWGWAEWIEEDDTEPYAKSFPKTLSLPLSNLPTPTAAPTGWLSVPESHRVGDASLRAFLRADDSQPLTWLPSRWSSFDAGTRQKLLVEVLHIYLTKLNVAQRDCCLIGIEPEVAALLFYGVARLLPRRGPAEQLSFSTCEPQNLRPSFALAATHAFKYGPLTLTEDPRICTFALNTFQPGWEKAPRNPRHPEPTATSFARRIVDLFVNSGPQAVNDFLDPFDNEVTHPQAPTANDLSDLLTAETYGRWLIIAAPHVAVPPAPTSAVGKGQVSAILQLALSSTPGVRLENPAVWRPLLQILAEDTFAEDCGTVASRAREDLIAKILLSVVGHAQELDSCLKDPALPPGLKARLLTRLIQDGKPLPIGEDDFWKGRFASPSTGRQQWLSLVADRVAEKQGAAGLARLMGLYANWLNAQPAGAQLAVQQSRASVLQALCEVARKHPQAGASAAVQTLVDRFLGDATHWHHELLAPAHWSIEQCRMVFQAYADRPQEETAVPAGDSPLAEWVRRDLETFPNPPLGVKTAPGVKPWLALLEAADRQLGLGCADRISAWKSLLELLTELPQHWAAKPNVWRARFEGPTWEARTNQLGDQISREAQIATHLQHCSESDTKAALQRLSKLQQLVAGSFPWDLGQIRDPLAARFIGEVGRTLRELGRWDSQRAKILVPRFSIPVQVGPKLLTIAIGLCVAVPLAWFGLSAWNVHLDAQVAKQKADQARAIRASEEQQLARAAAENKEQQLKDGTNHVDQPKKAEVAKQTQKEQENRRVTQAAPSVDAPAMANGTPNTPNDQRTPNPSNDARNIDLTNVAKTLMPHLSTAIHEAPPQRRCQLDVFKTTFATRHRFKTKVPPFLRYAVNPLGTMATRKKHLAFSTEYWQRTGGGAKHLLKVFELLLTDPDNAFRRSIALTLIHPTNVFENSPNGIMVRAEWLKRIEPPLPHYAAITTETNRLALANTLLSMLEVNVTEYLGKATRVGPSATPSDASLDDFMRDSSAFYIDSLLKVESERTVQLSQHRAALLTSTAPKFVNINEPIADQSGVTHIAVDFSITSLAIHGIAQLSECIAHTSTSETAAQTGPNAQKLGIGPLEWKPAEPNQLNAEDWHTIHNNLFAIRNPNTAKHVCELTFSDKSANEVVLKVPGTVDGRAGYKWIRLAVLEIAGIDAEGRSRVEWRILYDGEPTLIGRKGKLPASVPKSKIWTPQFSVLELSADCWKPRFLNKALIGVSRKDPKTEQLRRAQLELNAAGSEHSSPSSVLPLQLCSTDATQAILNGLLDVRTVASDSCVTLVWNTEGTELEISTPGAHGENHSPERLANEREVLATLSNVLSRAREVISRFRAAKKESEYPVADAEAVVKEFNECVRSNKLMPVVGLMSLQSTIQLAETQVTDKEERIKSRLKVVTELMKKPVSLADQLTQYQLDAAFVGTREIRDEESDPAGGVFRVPLWWVRESE